MLLSHTPHDALPRRGTARVTRTRVHARAYRGSAKVPLPVRGSLTDGRTAASLTSCTVRWRAPSSALAWRTRRARSVSSPLTPRGARMRRRVTGHFSRCSEVPSRRGPRSVGIDRTRRRDRARIRTIASFVEHHRGKSTACSACPARARERAARSTSRERARHSRRPRNPISARTATHRPFPPLLRPRLARLVPCALDGTNASNAPSCEHILHGKKIGWKIVSR